ncbi:MAG: hypothetical protein IKG01_09545 [Lachnospiraceae bacterium]|nr:hypothetical protein [Lachnospiraceae bacterium]
MLIARQIEIRNNIKDYFDTAYNGEVIIVPRKNGRNVVIISENEYMKLNREHMASYYAGLSPVSSENDSSSGSHSAQADNLNKLEEIGNLKDNWNGNGAAAIPPSLIKKARALIKNLTVQPEIFPTALQTIQLEFDNPRHDHMEIELALSENAEVFVAPYDDTEYFETIRSTPAAINERVSAFYG